MGFFSKRETNPQKMSDKDLQKDLRKSYGKNTGEDLSTRAHKIIEAEKRGLDYKPKNIPKTK